MSYLRVVRGCSLAALGAVSLAGLASSQDLPTRSPRVSSYQMQVELLPAQRQLRGTQEITWTNPTRSATSELRFHLYWNAFRNADSTFMREAGPEFRALWRADEYGGIVVERIALREAGTETELPARHVAVDDGNRHDQTVLQVDLPRPVGPGQSVNLTTRFSALAPKAYRRAGWIPDDGFFCMHWFPKLGVLEDRDGAARWNCHQFHANAEFFADFSVYDVVITVPEQYVLGATGVLVPERTARNGERKTLAFHAGDVHDFAWVADPDFVQHEATFGPVAAAGDPVAEAVAKNLGVPVQSFDLPPTQIVLLLQREHDTVEQRARHLEAVRCGLRFFGLRYGPYPYPRITAVDPGRDVMGRRLGGGMEYPMLITCGTALFPHDRELSPEGVTVHEFGHQYWYGLSANNEFEEAWLDEGLNTYSEGRAQTLHYGPEVRPVGVSSFGLLTLAAVPGPAAEPGGIRDLCRPLVEVLPAPWRAQLASLQLSLAPLPESPLLDLLRAQPTAAWFREVAAHDAWADRQRFLDTATPDGMVQPGWHFLTRPSYVANAYHRPATLLRTLERMVGRDRWWTFLRKFHAKARFAHPTTADFTRLLAAECGSGPAAFFEAASRAGATFDYGIESVEPPDGSGPEQTVIVRRYGILSADVRVRLRFEKLPSPEYRVIRGDDPYPWQRLRFADDDPGGPRGRLLEVWVDPPEGEPVGGVPFEGDDGPAGVYLLDANLLNNGWRAEPDAAPALYRGIRLLLQAQAQLSFVGWIG